MSGILTPDLENVLTLCYSNIGVFSKTFRADAFEQPFSELHNEICELIDSPAQKIAIAAPRGLGKTTIARSLVMRAILLRQYEFIPYVTNSATVAEMNTESIKRELRTNREVKRLFGDVEINADDPEIQEVFTKAAWVAYGNTLVLPRGAQQQVRGLLFKTHRPQLIIVDDLEKREELENPENRRKLKEWFHADLEKCVDRYSRKWKIVYIDTVKHHDSLMQELLEAPDWATLRLDICDDTFTSRVPQLISTEELRREVELHRKNGTLHIFYMEYRNMPTGGDDEGYKQEYYKYYDEIDLADKRLENFVIVDPAKTANMKSADSAVVGWGVDYKSGALYFRDCVNGKMYPDELYDEMFAMGQRLRAHVIGVEVTGLEEFIKQPIINEMIKRGPSCAFEFVWLKARGGPADGEKGKIKRIGSFVPYYRQGYVYHNRTCCATLEAQQLSFQRAKRIDVADASAYIIELLELGGRYFDAPELSDEESANEFADLEYEDTLSDWRIA
jgi:hypothetical protein